MAHYDGMVENEKINFQRAEIERIQREIISEVAKERQAWKNAIAIVLANPDEIGLIGDPTKANDVREALRPVATLQRENAELQKVYEISLQDRSYQDRNICKLEAKLAAAEAAIRAALERDGCRCDVQVCGWCKTDGWVYVSPDVVKQLRLAIYAAKTEVK